MNRVISEKHDKNELKEAIERHKYECLKKWVANERMEAFTALLNLSFAAIEVTITQYDIVRMQFR